MLEVMGLVHDPIPKTGSWIKRMLDGHLNYFAVSGGHPSLVARQQGGGGFGSGGAAKRHTAISPLTAASSYKFSTGPNPTYSA
jgi:hypothetical protein